MKELIFNSIPEFQDYFKDWKELRLNYAVRKDKDNFRTLIDTLYTGKSVDTNKMLDRIESIEKAQRNKSFSFNVAGYSPDIGRAVSGDPEHWRVKKGAKKIVTDIYINITNNCNVYEETIFNFGAAVLAYINKAEGNGLIIDNIYLYLYANGVNKIGKNKTDCIIKININQKPIDFNFVTFAITDSGFLRQLLLFTMEKMFDASTLENCGYGSAGSLQDIKGIHFENTRRQLTEDEAIELINKQVKESVL